jgi:hypothetical protein
MSTEDTTAGAEVLSQSEVERLLAQVQEEESSTVVHQTDGTRKQQANDTISA